MEGAKSSCKGEDSDDNKFVTCDVKGKSDTGVTIRLKAECSIRNFGGCQEGKWASFNNQQRAAAAKNQTPIKIDSSPGQDPANVDPGGN